MYTLTIIASYVMGYEILKYLKKSGCDSIQSFEGKGTVLLVKYVDNCYDDIRKLIITATCDEEHLNKTIADINYIFKFNEKNSGIIYSYKKNSDSLINCESGIPTKIADDKEIKEKSYCRMLFEIPKGFADEVILLSEKVGIKGGTVVESVFGLDRIHNKENKGYLNPSKISDAVIIIAESEKANSLYDVSFEKLPKRLREKPFRVNMQKLDIVSGLTV